MSSKTGGLREFGKFRLDAQRRVLWFENEPVNLPLKEIELLCVLTESSGAVVTKDELLEKVWTDSFVEESNLSRHIYVLRKTFKDYGEAADLIQTVPRRGYRFAGEVREVENGNGELVGENHALTPAAATTTEIWDDANGIAVLPFVNLSADAEDDFFCDGLAEELLNTLAKIENLKVAARTSSFAFKNKNLGVGEIGRALNVNLILEGSVGRVGNQLRVTARLVSAADGFQLWSERFDREIKDIFDVQDEITLAIVEVLKVKLRVEEKSALLKHYTDDAEVYELYLKGCYHANRHTGENLQTAIRYFKQAIEKEPNYAPAYAGVAICLLTLWYFGTSPSHEIVPQWRAMASRALEIDDSLPEAHSLLGSFNFYYERNAAEGEKEYRRAIKIKPNSPDSYWRLGLLLASVGRFDEAVEAGKRAVELDPLSLLVNLYVGIINFFADRQDEASERARKILKIEPRFFGAYWLAGIVHKAKGEYEEAAEQLQKAVELGGNQTILSILGGTYGLMGKPEEAVAILDGLLETRERQYVSAFDIARIYSGLGEADKGLEWLEKAFEERNGELVFLEAETKIGAGFEWNKAFREDSRFSNLLAKHFPRPLLAAKTEARKGKVSDAGFSSKRRVLTFWRFRAAAIAAVLILLFAAGFWFWRYETENVQTAEIKSIAVLPLKSFSAETGDESLRMRITDALITRLGGSDKIAVRPTNAVLPFAGGAGDNALEIGEKLRTDAILDGRIQQENERVRVTLQLIRVADGKQIWAEQFDGQANEILNLQDVISAKVLQALNPNRPKPLELAVRPTENPEAYEAYLRGRYHWNKRSAEAFERAIVYFEKAIALDPKFAEAYSGLSDAHFGLYDYGIKPADECIPQAKSSSNQALQLKPNSAEAHSTLSAIQFLYDRNWSEAEKSIVKSIELNPQYSTARLRYGWFLTMMGRFDEARRELETALEQDPTSAIVQTNIGYLSACTGNTGDAERRFYQIIDAHPQFSLPYWYLGSIYFQQGNRAAMFENYLKAFELDDEKAFSSKIRDIWQNKGEAAALTFWREKLEKDAEKSHLPPTNIALIAAIQKDKEAALRWLTEAERQKDPWLLQIKYDHEYDFLRGEPRFQEILRKMNLS